MQFQKLYSIYWGEVGIQIRMKGDTQKISETEDDQIFSTRGRWLQKMSHSWNQRDVIEDIEAAKT